MVLVADDVYTSSVNAYAATMPSGEDDAHTVAVRVSDTLREAFSVLATSSLDGDDKQRWQRRLIAITNMSKHDVARAHEQLQRFIGEWNALDTGKDIVQ